MRCVILAAGEGERLKEYKGDLPKPLIPILGMSLIERVLLSLKESGITQFLVVTGYRASKIRKFLGDGSKYGVSIEYYYNPCWYEGNGSSLHVLNQELSDERFLVAMSDHIFQPEAVNKFVNWVEENGGLFLLTDSRKDHIRNIADATKVAVLPDGTIMAIGKELKDYSKIDCGLFCLDSDIFRALDEVMKAGKYKLSDGVGFLVNKLGRKIQTVDIGDFYWQDIDEREDIIFVERKLLSSLPNPKDGIVSKYLNRRISIPITKRISKFSISPNQMSFLVFFLGIFSGVLFFLGKSVFAGLLAQVDSILDGVDGEIARLKHAQSKLGGLIDSLLDRYVDTVIIAGLVYYSYLITRSVWALILGVLTLAACPLSMVLKDRFNLFFRQPFDSSKMDGVAKFLLPNRDGRLFLVMVGGLIPKLLLPVLFLLALGSNMQIITRVLLIKKKLEKTREKSPEAGKEELLPEIHSHLS